MSNDHLTELPHPINPSTWDAVRRDFGGQPIYHQFFLTNYETRTPPKDTIECRRSGDDVSITELLYGLAPSKRDTAWMSVDQMKA